MVLVPSTGQWAYPSLKVVELIVVQPWAPFVKIAVWHVLHRAVRNAFPALACLLCPKVDENHDCSSWPTSLRVLDGLGERLVVRSRLRCGQGCIRELLAHSQNANSELTPDIAPSSFGLG